MTNGPERNLKFYCPTHRIRFQASGEAVISCEQGGHTVGAGFPLTSWWEFCCDCGTFWPTDSAGGSPQRTECLVCERPLAKRYLCANCQVVSIESSAIVRRKTYSIEDSGITPDCPGCATAANGRLHQHDCSKAKVRLLTSRSTCPFCETDLDAKKSSKPARPATARVTVCPTCATEQEPGNLFCGRCGKALPVAAARTKSGAASAPRKAEQTEARQQTKEARQRAAAEALRIAEEQSRRGREAKRKADEWRLAQAAYQEADRQSSTVAAAIEAGKKAYQEEKRKVELAEARRQEEERQRVARESQQRAEKEAARKAAEEEASRTAERLRQAEEARARAEQEQHRLKEVQRRQAEHERLVTELHQRAKEEEAQRAKEIANTASDERSLKTPESEHETELDGKTQPMAASVENQVQGLESQVENEEPPPASASRDLAAEPTTKPAAQQPLQQPAGPKSIGHSTIDEAQPPLKTDSFSNSDKSSNEVVIASEYVPFGDRPSSFTDSSSRRGRRVWLVGLLLVVAVGTVLTVIATKQPVNTGDNANARPLTKATGPIVPAGMVRVPGGEFTLGSDRANADQQEKPAHQVTLAPFYIDTTEVTCEDYEKFVKATGHKPPAKWSDGSCPSSELRKPVTGVDWYDAGAYAQWANKRLPTEEEWEFAARGATGWIYPWGDEWRKGVANADNAAAGVAIVGTFKGTSPFQCYDMVGNAWEWTASKLVPYPGGKLGQKAGDDLRVIRGGSWQSDRDSATTTYRFGWPARGGKDYSNTSFRCALDAERPGPAPGGH